MIRLKSLARVALPAAFALLAAVPGVSGAASDAVRDAFMQALAAIERGEAPPRSAALQRYILAPYLDAAAVRRLIARDRPEADDAWRAYRAAHPDHVENRDLQREWWRSLARRQAWATLWAEVPAEVSVVDLQCERLRAGLETGQDPAVLVPQIQAAFKTGRSMPSACDRPFEWLAARGGRPSSLVIERFELALAANEFGLSRFLLKMLPENERAPYARRLALRTAPATAIPALRDAPPATLPWDDLFSGWNRWVAADADAAQRMAPRLAGWDRLTEAQRAAIWNAVGLRLSWRREPAALTAFARAGLASDDARVHEWRVRAALWAGEFEQADRWLAVLPATLMADPRWRYWRARVDEKRKGLDSARGDYQSLLSANNVYALLAAERLGVALVPQPRPGAPLNPAVQKAFNDDPAVQRMRELHALDLRPRFNLEWFAFFAGRDMPTYDQLSQFAFAQGWWVNGVASSTSARIFDDFERLYPRPYDALVARAAAESGLPAALIYGLIRQESLYEPRARSHANAYGLMQLLLPTARGVAQRHNLPRPDVEALYQPARNVALGARYLAERFQRFDGQWMPAIASYNAGAGAVDRWLPETPKDADIWMENVPYNETRNYIGKLMWHQAVYAWLSTGEPQRATAALRPVTAPQRP